MNFRPILALLIIYTSPLIAQVDPDATEKTKILYENLKKVQDSKGFLFGQEFFNSFRYSSGSAHGDETYSDSYAVTGFHPAVLGSDFHYYLEKSSAERTYHTEAVRWAYEQGFVITFDWHISGRGTTTYEYTETSADLLDNILTDTGDDREWFFGELDKVIDIINNDLVSGGENIPIIFRPFHEMNGNWFWWGSKATDAIGYQTFYQMIVDYMKERTNSVLFCWSPNLPMNMNYYPGDPYVDVLGLDYYEVNESSLRSNLAPIVDRAQASGKVAVLSETGNRTTGGASPGDNASTYWLNTVLPAIVGDPSGKARKIAWVLTWINASWSYPYVPNDASSAVAKNSFIDFKDSGYVHFGGEIENMYEPLPDFTVSVETEAGAEADIEIHDNQGTLYVRVAKHHSALVITDLLGRRVLGTPVQGGQTSSPLNTQLRPGIYVLTASGSRGRVAKKFVITRTVTAVVIER